MEPNIILVGSGKGKSLELLRKIAVIAVPSTTSLQTERIIEIKPRPVMPELLAGKEFICKGKHQYREVKRKESGGIITVTWACQCGRKIND